MSLDVYLYEPSLCAQCGHENSSGAEIYSANITHNLGPMAKAAELYACMWRPEEHGMSRARDLIPHLRKGLAMLRDVPTFFDHLNSPNGWGKYEHFVPFVERYLRSCEEYPDALVRVSR